MRTKSFGGIPYLLKTCRGYRRLEALPTMASTWLGNFTQLLMVIPSNLKVSTCLTTSSWMVMGGRYPLPCFS